MISLFMYSNVHLSPSILGNNYELCFNIFDVDKNYTEHNGMDKY
jgi:hypothetical protein